jgi:hypothetical protein
MESMQLEKAAVKNKILNILGCDVCRLLYIRCYKLTRVHGLTL